MASEATKMAVRSNIHIDDMVIEVTEFNSEVRTDLRGHYHCCTLVFRAIALLLSNDLKACDVLITCHVRMTGGLCCPLARRRLLPRRRRPPRVLRHPPLPRPRNRLHRLAARFLHGHQHRGTDQRLHPGHPGPLGAREAAKEAPPPPPPKQQIFSHLAFLLCNVR